VLEHQPDIAGAWKHRAEVPSPWMMIPHRMPA
jgi:hypothetical protein